MASALDIHLLPVARYAGQDYPELLCLHASDPPRRRARGRELDRLILYLAMAGNAPLPPGKQVEVLSELAKLFYQTPGSVTSAMRRVAEELNKELLERNLRLSSGSRQGLGVLVQMVVRGGETTGQPANQLTLGISGPAQAYLISGGGVQQYNSPSPDAEAPQSVYGLGQSKAAPLGFFQGSLQSGDTLLLAAQPAADWSVDMLSSLHGQGPESLRRRLFGQPVTEVNAVLVQARTGKGAINLPRLGKPQPTAASSSAAAQNPVSPQPPPVAAQNIPSQQPITTAALIKLQNLASQQPLASASQVKPQNLATQQLTTPPQPGPAQSSASSPPALQQPAATQDPVPLQISTLLPPLEVQNIASQQLSTAAARPPRRSPAVGKSLLAAIAILTGALGRVASGIRLILMRILPEESLAGIPSSVMAFSAVAVPVVIVVVTSVVYLQLGRDTQRETLLAQARRIGTRAVSQTDVPARHDDLTTALDLLNRVEVYGVTPETQALRSELRGLLDELELVGRLDYKQAIIGGLLPTIRITRLAVFEDDLYMLDGGSGNVLRATRTSQGYQLDNNFACGANAGIAGLGPLIDIEIWPVGYTPAGNLLAMDAAGTIVYCKNDAPPEKATLTAAADAESWGKLSGFALDEGDAYVLDTLSKSVWIYPHSEFGKAPIPFFSEEITGIANVVDLTVNRADLYLLHADGKLTLCVYSDFQGVPTRCSQPSYLDARPGRENTPLVPPSPFTQILNTAPPDPSLFLLEPQNQSIYHFSLRNLAFQGQYMPDQDVAPGPATAFAVDNIRRYLFLAVGNQVYYAILP